MPPVSVGVVVVESSLDVVVVSVVPVESVVVVVVVVVVVSVVVVSGGENGPSCKAEVPLTLPVVDPELPVLPFAGPCPFEEAVALESELDGDPGCAGADCADSTAGEGAVSSCWIGARAGAGAASSSTIVGFVCVVATEPRTAA
jgi:hypothetical protein